MQQLERAKNIRNLVVATSHRNPGSFFFGRCPRTDPDFPLRDIRSAKQAVMADMIRGNPVSTHEKYGGSVEEPAQQKRGLGEGPAYAPATQHQHSREGIRGI